MEKKLRVYCAAAMAFHFRIDMPDDGGIRDGEYVEQFPALIPAESIEAAAEAARPIALERWKPSDEWYGHQITIEPVTEQFFDAAAAAATAGVIGEDDEAPKTFYLSDQGISQKDPAAV